jgi:hypothetical protein
MFKLLNRVPVAEPSHIWGLVGADEGYSGIGSLNKSVAPVEGGGYQLRCQNN